MLIPNPADVSMGLLRAFKNDKTIGVVDEVPEGFTEIDFSGCTNLRWIGKLPSTTRKLDLNGCRKLWWLPDLTKLTNLEELNLDGTRMRRLNGLPPSLRELYASHCPRLRCVKVLPAALVTVHMDGNPRLSTVGTMSDTVERYSARRCPRLRDVGKLSAKLVALGLSETFVAKVGPLTDTLRTLDLSGTPITELPDLTTAPALSSLDVSGCTRLHGDMTLPCSVRIFRGRGLTNFVVTTTAETKCYF